MSGTAELRSPVDRPREGLDPDFGLDCSFVKENAGALALGALDPDERRRIERHLSWCPGCAALIFEARRTVAHLPYLSALVTPPVRAKRHLFEAIEALSAEPAAIRSAVVPSATLTIPASTDALAPRPGGWSGERSAVSAQRKRRFAWELALAPLAAVPLVLALTIVGGWALRTQGQMHDQTAELQLLRSENEDLENKVLGFTSSSGSNVVQNFSLDSSESMTGGGPGGTIKAVANQPLATLQVWKLDTSVDRYQVVVEGHDGSARTVGSFTVDAQGRATVNLDLARPLETYRILHVLPDPGTTRAPINDSLGASDVLWMYMQGTLGARSGTEAGTVGN